MDTVLGFVNALACGVVAVVLGWAILSPRVKDGIVIKSGLICMAFGFGSIAMRLADGSYHECAAGLERSLLLVNVGAAVMVLGFVWRKSASPQRTRRSTDWATLDDTQPAEERRHA